MIAKYIIIRHRGEELPIVWPNLGTVSHTLEHVHVAKAVVEDSADVISAGSCIPCDSWRCFGESLSLGLKSRGEADTAVMLRHFAGPVLRPQSSVLSPVSPDPDAALVAPLKLATA